MSDILERLRDHQNLGNTVTKQFRAMVSQRREAADEIARLRRELSRHVHTDADIDVQNAEIVRLQDTLKTCRELREIESTEIARLQAKIERREEE